MLFKIIKAPITPGTHPQIVNNIIIIKDPQPLSIIERGGKKTASNTLKIFIINVVIQP